MLKWSAVVAVLGLVGAGCFLQVGGRMMLGSTFTLENLNGLSRDQVVERLGTPWYDPKQGLGRPWNEAIDGPYYLGYIQGWAHCTIRFSNGVVASVETGWK